MYRRPKFLEVLLEIRQEMSRDADYDVDLFAEMIRSDAFGDERKIHALGESDADKGEKSGSRKRKKS